MTWYDEKNLEACMSAVVRFVITRVITDRIGLHYVLLPLQTFKLKVDTDCNTKNRIFAKAYIGFFQIRIFLLLHMLFILFNINSDSSYQTIPTGSTLIQSHFFAVMLLRTIDKGKTDWVV